MADASGERNRKRKRRRGHERRKLLPGEKVEVLGTGEGLIGSWHEGVVVSCGKGSRIIEFNDLLSDDYSSKLVESVTVLPAIDGRARKTPERYRGQVRPLPPHYEFKEHEIRYGLCVDSLVDDAWWEGVVFDHEEGSSKRLVFYPDEGDQLMVAIDQLRLTQEWNVVSGTWKPRGEWVLLQVLETFEQEGPLPVSIREIWYDLRTTAAFWDNIGLWIFGSQSVWQSLVSQLIQQLLSVVHGLPPFEGSKHLIDNEPSKKLVSEHQPRRTRSSREGIDVTREMAKAHLLALGWKFNTSYSGHKSYVSPFGEHYSSFIKACIACQELESHDKGSLEADNIYAHVEKRVDGQSNPEATTSWQRVDLEPEYDSEAVEICAYSSENEKNRREKSKSACDNMNLVRLRAKKHLRALGWKIESSRDSVLRIRVLSPEGKCFYSLHKACCHLLLEHQKEKQKSRDDRSSGSVSSIMQSRSVKKNEPHTERSRKTFQNSKRRKAPKRPREVSSSVRTQHVARTILSLLIDNDMVLPRQKVRYIRRRDGYVMMEGRITREGIKCKCCEKVYTLTNFEAHAGSTNHRPAANIFLQDGRSLMECQMKMVNKKKPKDTPNMQMFSHPRLKSDCSAYQNDNICSVCHDVGEVVLCDHCPSSFHLSCVGLEDVSEENWFCPSCRCGICGHSEFDSDTGQFTEKTILYCEQCEREYHVGCLREKLESCPVGKWFCSTTCSKIFHHLQKLIGKPRQTATEGLSWTILRSSKEAGADAETMAEHHSKLCVALDVLHECFLNIIEPRTHSDLITDIVFNKESELNRLNFWGFYTMLLERGDELISVATFRVYGEKVAEVPLVGTRVKYRRQGMCCLLINELEKLLAELEVERLILPAVPQLIQTWTNSFGFTEMTSSCRLGLLEYSLLNFYDTTLCQKLLSINQLALGTEVVETVDPIKAIPSLHTDANLARGKCRENPISVHTSLSDLVEKSTAAPFKFLKRFKYVYRRRISSN